MRVHTVVRVGGVLTAAGLLLSPTPAWADHQDGWSPQPQTSEQPQDYPQQWEPGASSDPTSPAQDDGAAGSRSGTSKQMAPARSSTSTVTATDIAAAQAAAATCPTDDGLPAPVAGTVVDTVGTVQDTVEGVAGPLPVDVSGTLGGALGCTPEPSASPEPTPSDEPTDPPSQDPQAGDSGDLAAISNGLPEAASAEAVDAQVAFAG